MNLRILMPIKRTVQKTIILKNKSNTWHTTSLGLFNQSLLRSIVLSILLYVALKFIIKYFYKALSVAPFS